MKASERAAEVARKAKHEETAQRNAEIESARIRAMFDEDRERLTRRYASISLMTKG